MECLKRQHSDCRSKIPDKSSTQHGRQVLRHGQYNLQLVPD